MIYGVSGRASRQRQQLCSRHNVGSGENTTRMLRSLFHGDEVLERETSTNPNSLGQAYGS